jgi:uncharacterized protein YndB with AHSA1/START domain
MNPITDTPGVVRLVRTLEAPAADVFNAFIDPDQIARWYGPSNCVISEVQADARVGGQFRARMVSEGGTRGHFVGEFQELVPGERLVMQWGWEDEDGDNEDMSRLTIELREQDSETTELTLIHELGERTPGGYAGVTDGWNGALDKLAGLFQEDKA